MNEELVQAAIQTFCIVPEIYQQAFKQSGVDFPDELVVQIKQNPESAIEMVQKDKQLGDAIVQIFSNNQEAIMQAAQQAQQQTGMFKKGGKLNYALTKFQIGGHLVRKGQNSIKTDNLNFGSNQSWRAADRSRLRMPPYRGFVKDRSVGMAIDENGGKYLRESAVVDGNAAVTDVYIPAPGDTLVRQNLATKGGARMRYYPQGSEKYESVMGRLRPLLKKNGGNL